MTKQTSNDTLTIPPSNLTNPYFYTNPYHKRKLKRFYATFAIQVGVNTTIALSFLSKHAMDTILAIITRCKQLLVLHSSLKCFICWVAVSDVYGFVKEVIHLHGICLNGSVCYLNHKIVGVYQIKELLLKHLHFTFSPWNYLIDILQGVLRTSNHMHKDTQTQSKHSSFTQTCAL